LVRERQDLVGQRQKREQRRGRPGPRERNARAEAENVARLAAIDARIADIDKRLKAAGDEVLTISARQQCPDEKDSPVVLWRRSGK
jgi:hypothetical protein